MSHSTCTHQDRVDSRLFVVGSQIANLTPGPSFDHNLCYKCLNGSCEAIFDIYTSGPFQRYKEHLKARCLDLCNRALKLRESQRTPSSHFWECKFHLRTCLKVGLRHDVCILQGMFQMPINLFLNNFSNQMHNLTRNLFVVLDQPLGIGCVASFSPSINLSILSKVPLLPL